MDNGVQTLPNNKKMSVTALISKIISEWSIVLPLSQNCTSKRNNREVLVRTLLKSSISFSNTAAANLTSSSSASLAGRALGIDGSSAVSVSCCVAIYWSGERGGERKGRERQRCQLFTLVEDRQTTALPPVQTNDQQVYHGGIADMGVYFLSVCFRNTPHASFFILFSPITVNKRACNVVLRDADGDTYLP